MRKASVVRSCAADAQRRRPCVDLTSDPIVSSSLARTTQAGIESGTRLDSRSQGRKSAGRLTVTHHPGE